MGFLILYSTLLWEVCGSSRFSDTHDRGANDYSLNSETATQGFVSLNIDVLRNVQYSHF